MDSEAESLFVSTFIRKEKRNRLKELLPHPKRRAKVLSTLDHFRDLDERFATLIPDSEQSTDLIYSRLIKLGAPAECHLISSNQNWDGIKLPLFEALNTIIGMGMGTLVICQPTQLGYYEGESANDRWILKK